MATGYDIARLWHTPHGVTASYLTGAADGDQLSALVDGVYFETQPGGAPPAGPYQGISVVGIPVSIIGLSVTLLLML